MSERSKEYYLMHKDIPVCLMEISEEGEIHRVRLDEIVTHSFIEKESRLLHYVRNRDLVDLEKARMDYSIYEQDVTERHVRIPILKELYERKLEKLSVFQRGADIWKTRRYTSG